MDLHTQTVFDFKDVRSRREKAMCRIFISTEVSRLPHNSTWTFFAVHRDAQHCPHHPDLFLPGHPYRGIKSSAAFRSLVRPTRRIPCFTKTLSLTLAVSPDAPRRISSESNLPNGLALEVTTGSGATMTHLGFVCTIQ